VRCWIASKSGGIELVEADAPKPEAGQVLVRFRAAAVTHADAVAIAARPAAKRSGPRPKARPFGLSVVGRVEELGPDVSGMSGGMPVFVSEPPDGAYAELLCVPYRSVTPLPESVRVLAASVLPPLAVAYSAAERGALQPGSVALVIGQGTTGLLLTRVLHHAGARVVAADLSDEKLEIAKTFGAHLCVNVAREPLAERLRAVAPEGAAAVFPAHYDAQNLTEAVHLTAPGGRVVLLSELGVVERFDTRPMTERAVDLLSLPVVGSHAAAPRSRAIRALASREIDAERVVTHRLPLEALPAAAELADGTHPEVVQVVVEAE